MAEKSGYHRIPVGHLRAITGVDAARMTVHVEPGATVQEAFTALQYLSEDAQDGRDVLASAARLSRGLRTVGRFEAETTSTEDAEQMQLHENFQITI